MRNKTIFITGASKGIGRMALQFAKDGANLALAAKINAPSPSIPGTMHSVATEVEELWRASGVENFEVYALQPNANLLPDLLV